MTPPENPRQPEDSASKEVRDLGERPAPWMMPSLPSAPPRPNPRLRRTRPSPWTWTTRSFEDAVQQAAAEGPGRVDAGVPEEQDSPLLDADLDRIEGHAAREGAMRGREDMFAATDADVRARQEAAATRELAESADDESVMGGVPSGPSPEPSSGFSVQVRLRGSRHDGGRGSGGAGPRRSPVRLRPR